MGNISQDSRMKGAQKSYYTRTGQVGYAEQIKKWESRVRHRKRQDAKEAERMGVDEQVIMQYLER